MTLGIWFHRRLLRLAHPEPRRHLLTGLIASLAIMVSSWGVGWLPSSQFSWFAHSTVLNPLRVETAGVLTCAIVLVTASLLLVRCWLCLGQDLRLPHTRYRGINPEPEPGAPARLEHARYRVLTRAMVLWTLPLIFTFPIFSRDVYSYIAQGQVLHSGWSPYETGVSTLPGWFSQGADSIWAESPSPYGPLFLLLAQGITFVSGQVPEIAVLLFRVVSIAGLFLCWYTVIELSRRFGARPDWALWVSVLNPLVSLYLVAGVHNDSLMLGLLLAGFLLLGSYRPTTGWWLRTVVGLVLIACSIGIKPLTILALPFAGMMLCRPDPHDQREVSYRQRILAWGLCAVVVGAVMTVFGWISGLWFGWIPAMTTAGDAAFPYAPFGLLGLGIGWITDALAQTGIRPVADVVYTLGTVISAVVVAYLALKRSVTHPVISTGIALIVSILLAPIIQPWYLLWVLPLFAVVRLWHPRWSWMLYLLIMVLVVIGVVDQVSVAEWIPILLVRVITGVIGVIGMAGLLFWDPATSQAFPPQRDRDATTLRHLEKD
ncbi:polyprenol phosphomannose-dependent alpha 1,6 mannosyltransferase MptB [Auritidibacter ignavus]|uniref:polyprenol phosphomannose-dependent alpha 1,6 mannosyltransferase MptB n=1 Tax=Auritidibacter ignavus TaxID=678932 RepID=UPI00244BBE2E|nr:polyprenol phosphomannose-dependent alpha 1,6 mannosyltransferase MptB [Auritidibacter ignavus]WGH86522.1 polyprenol phosphomannose-dependent alpha 1,6 mannosyltransferase MptB [Auritidibacter ignavus]WGH88808.1 polyprenol phosphomannose-dependent alpha 1,6 mannosyltransferase MptB [Auritidibacter ignavus]